MLSTKELKKELKKRGLGISGNRTQLIDRLTGNKWTLTYTPSGNFLTGSNTPSENIWIAALQGNYSMVRHHLYESIMRPNYNIDQLSLFGRTVLHQACLGGNSSIITLLIKEGSIDLSGTAYLASSRNNRKILSNFGYKGLTFISLPHTKLLQAKRNLALSQMDINYDIITLLVKYTNKCFTNKPLHHAVYKRSLNEIAFI
jgi:ankyrin repeat protein|tara:strand:+ start:224 stop:826 length:603 start_codon:yes stop_codon:yes gene_type:complete